MKQLITRSQKAPIVMAWASFPGPTLAPQGFYFFTNVGINGSMWYNNGTTLDPVGPVVLHRLLAQATGTNGIAEEALSVSPKIPAGVLKIGRKLITNFYVSKTGTVETVANFVKIGTNSNGVTGAASITSSLSLATTSRQLAMLYENLIVSATQVQATILGGSAVPYGSNTSTTFGLRNIADISNDLYISLTNTKTTGGIETVTVYSFEVILS